MTRLSVNINKIALLRNARGGNNPDVLKAALKIEQMGAQGITVHPRPDERHIRRSDVTALKGAIATELNVEGYPSEEFMDLVLSVRPAQVTLVPDAPGQLTSDHGWDVATHADFLRSVIARLEQAGIRSSLFVDALPAQVEAASSVGARRVELYTGPFAAAYATDARRAIAPFVEAARTAKQLGLGLNAGHDLSLENLAFFHRTIPGTDEVSIGHALICDALRMGMASAVQAYLLCLR